MPVSPEAVRRLLFPRCWPGWAVILISTSLIHWGYPLGELHFSNVHFYEKELPPLWGLSIVDPRTREVDLSLLHHNEGLMTLNHKRPSDGAELRTKQKGLNYAD